MSLTDKDKKSRKKKSEKIVQDNYALNSTYYKYLIYIIKLGLFDEDRSSKKSEIIRKVTFCKESHHLQKIAWWSQKITYFVQPCLQVPTKCQTQINKYGISLVDKSIFLKCTFELRIIIDFIIYICKQISS